MRSSAPDAASSCCRSPARRIKSRRMRPCGFRSGGASSSSSTRICEEVSMKPALLALFLAATGTVAQTPPQPKPADNSPPGNTSSEAPPSAAKDAPAAGVVETEGADEGCRLADADKHIDAALAALRANPAYDEGAPDF